MVGFVTHFIEDLLDQEGCGVPAALYPYIAEQLVEISQQGILACENQHPVLSLTISLYHDEERGIFASGPVRCREAGHAVLQGILFRHGGPADQAGAG